MPNHKHEEQSPRDPQTQRLTNRRYMDEDIRSFMSIDTVTQRLRDVQIKEDRDPETHLHWITEVQEYARTWGCKDIETHRHWNTEVLGQPDTVMHKH